MDGELARVGGRLGEAAAAWARSRWLEVEGHPVRYREAGDGVPLVLVHGLGVSADYWVRAAPAIAAAGFRVVAPDLPGFGRTAGPDAGLGVHAQARALERFGDALRLDPAFYLGHSLSCQTVLELAVRRPERVRGILLAAPTGERRANRRLVRQAFGLLRDIPRESVALASLIAQAYLRAGPLRVLRTWRLGALHDPMPLLAQVAAPALVLLGERDPVVRLEFAERIARGLPRGELAVIPGAAHGVIFEPTGAFNRCVIDFIRAHVA